MTDVDRKRAASIPARSAAAAKRKVSRAAARGRVRDLDQPPRRTAGSPSRRTAHTSRPKLELPDLDRKTAADVAAREILSALAAIASAHRDAIVAGEVSPRADVGAVHDLRIAVRRARTLLGQLRGVFSRSSTQQLRDDLRWLGELSGPVRNIDVLEKAVARERDVLTAADRGALDPVTALLAREREQARVALVEGLQSTRHARLVEALTRFAAANAVGEAKTDRSAAAMPIEVIAAESIERAWKRLIRHGRALDRGSPAEALHRVRIDGKKLRYLLEMFRALYPDAELGPLIACLKKLQDCLGAVNDARVEQETLRRLARGFDAGSDRESGDSTAALVLIGRLIERVGARGEAAKRRFPERFDDLRSKDHRKRIKALLG